MKLSEFDYELPPDRIAQHPVPRRDESRLLVLQRDREPGIEHALFRDLVLHLSAPDLLVVNDTRVLPARLIGRKETGGRIELLLVEPESRPFGVRKNDPSPDGKSRSPDGGGPSPDGNGRKPDGSGRSADGDLRTPDGNRPSPDGNVDLTVGLRRNDDRIRSPDGSGRSPDGEVWLCLAGFSRAPAAGTSLDFGPGLESRYLGPANGEMHRVLLRPSGEGTLRETLARTALVPLPPYIRRNGESRADREDAARYQTVYADKDGAIAAPTAGLHFTEDLLASLGERGIGVAKITLHVGPATFLPVRTVEIEDHPMPAERYEISSEAAEAIGRARARGGRIVAVGTTVVRALESASDGRGGVLPARSRTDLFIYPGCRLRAIDALITNFHLPRSTLIALVSAFAGRERILAAYQEAIKAGYRFYSYGDAMLIL